jgi:hypothetical protein
MISTMAFTGESSSAGILHEIGETAVRTPSVPR